MTALDFLHLRKRINWICGLFHQKLLGFTDIFLCPVLTSLIRPLIDRGYILLDFPSNSVDKNRSFWNAYDWSRAGEEWSDDSKKFKNIEPNLWKKSLVEGTILKYVKQDALILEIGPGAGRWTAELKGLAKKLFVADISTKCLDLCKERFKDSNIIEYHQTDGNLAFIEDNGIDFIWSYDVFVHINPRDIRRYLVEMHRVLKPGGIGVIHHVGKLPSKSGFKGGFRTCMSKELFSKLVTDCKMTIIEQNEQLVHKPGDIISVFSKPLIA